MLRTITDPGRIAAAQENFRRRVEGASARTERLQLGFQGGGLEAETHLLPRFGIWVAVDELENRFWNALGLGDPRKDDRSIIVEVNPPKAGLDRRVSGLFLEDASGQVFMAHRGRVGGGRKGIGKEAFRDWYPGSFVTIRDGGAPASVILLGKLEGERFLNDLAEFTHRVATFKHAATQPAPQLPTRPRPTETQSGRTIVLISCSASKADRPAPAEDLYQGTLFKAAIAWAREQNPDAIHILSAKHHLVSPDEVIEPYDLTLNDMPADALRRWSDTVLEQLESEADVKRDRFIILAGDRYRRFLTPRLGHVELPLKGLRLGEQVQFLQRRLACVEPPATDPVDCAAVHRHLAALPRFRFPFDPAHVPKNGIYVLFESGERAHGTDRIVRVGTHRGQDQLPARLKEHFLTENKDRSIFRKNIGRALLHRERSPLAKQWEIDLTTREARERYGPEIDRTRIQEVERRVSKYMRSNLTFAVFEVPDKSARLRLEAGLIAAVNRCSACSPSPAWLGRHSPKPQIAGSGLWLVQGLTAEPLTTEEWRAIERSRTERLAHANRGRAHQKKQAKTPQGYRPMPKKYEPLEEYLRNSGKNEITLTFNEIESILGRPLPPSASDHRPWWSNPRDSRTASQQSAWLNAGYRVASVSLGSPGSVRFERVATPQSAHAAQRPATDQRRSARTHGGRQRHFEWWLDGMTLRIRNTHGLEHRYGLAEVIGVLAKLHNEFGTGWFPLANNVEKLNRGTENAGLGSAIYARPGADTLHAQGASYLGVVLEDAGILEWNGERRGIQWRIEMLPLSANALARQLRVD
jgi:hypothetical protein